MTLIEMYARHLQVQACSSTVPMWQTVCVSVLAEHST